MEIDRDEVTTTTEDAPHRASRRSLFKAAAGMAAVAGATGVVGAPAAAAATTADGRGIPVSRISLQLYSVRQLLNEDVDGTLAALHEQGYRNVETAGAPAGLSVAEFREALDDHGLRATSAHIGIPQPFDAAAWRASLRDAQTLGATFVNHPFFGSDANGPIRDAARYEALAGDLNRAGHIARNYRLQFGYHNHNNEFIRMDDGSGRTGMEILFSWTNSALVHFELDLFWAFRGAADPVDVIQAHPGRIRQLHVKDIDAGGSFADVGEGFIDFRRIFELSGRAGVVEYVVERDDAATPPRTQEQALQSTETGFDYLSSVRF